jgi:hypothetical protein
MRQQLQLPVDLRRRLAHLLRHPQRVRVRRRHVRAYQRRSLRGDEPRGALRAARWMDVPAVI